MTFTAVLLAGGESRRMGSDKATLRWRGRPLWEWQLEKLRALTPERILLSARSDLPWRPSDVELLPDIPPSRGPLSGLAAALDTMETDHLLALAVDLPFMTTEHLRFLCERARPGTGIVPMIKGTAEPLSAIYPGTARTHFLEALPLDDSSLQPIVRRLVALNMLQAFPVPDEEHQFYKNVNKPEELD